MRIKKNKKLAITRISKKCKLVIIQAKTDQAFNDLMKNPNGFLNLGKTCNVKFIVINKDFKVKA